MEIRSLSVSATLALPLLVLLVLVVAAPSVRALEDEDPYKVLGVPRTADDAAIKRRHRELLATYHPDKNTEPGAEDKYYKIQEAYDILSDPHKRQSYDLYGSVREHKRSGGGNSGGWGAAWTGGGGGHAGGPFSRTTYLTSDNYAAFVENGSPTDIWLILFYSEYYGPVGPVFAAFDALSEEVGGAVRFGRINIREQRYLAAQFNVDYVPQVVAYTEGKYRIVSRGVSTRDIHSWLQSNMPSHVAAVVSNSGPLERKLAELLPVSPVLLVISPRDAPTLLTKRVARQFAGEIAVLHVQARVGAEVLAAVEPLFGAAGLPTKGAMVLVSDALEGTIASLARAAELFDGPRDIEALTRWLWTRRLAAFPRLSEANTDALCRGGCVVARLSESQHAAEIGAIRAVLVGAKRPALPVVWTDGDLDGLNRALDLGEAGAVVVMHRGRCASGTIAALAANPTGWGQATDAASMVWRPCKLEGPLRPPSVIWSALSAVRWVFDTIRSIIVSILSLVSVFGFLIFLLPALLRSM